MQNLEYVVTMYIVPVSTLYRNKNEWGSGTATTSHFKMAAHRKFNDQNQSLGVNFIHRIIKFDLDTSQRKLLFEINIVGQARFPLRISGEAI